MKPHPSASPPTVVVTLFASLTDVPVEHLIEGGLIVTVAVEGREGDVGLLLREVGAEAHDDLGAAFGSGLQDQGKWGSR